VGASKSVLLVAAVLAVGDAALAAPPISSGGAIQQIPETPALQHAVPVIPAPPGSASAPSDNSGPSVVVNALHITGETRFHEARLIAVTGFRPGRRMNLSGLRGLAARITRFYNEHGYIVAQAYLPPQEIRDGAVRIVVIEGRYGKIGVSNRTNIPDVRLVSMLDGLNSGDAIIAAPLDRRLLLMSDLPGINVSSTLAPGTEVGTSDLLVGATPGPRVDGSFEADNAGNPYTGRYRVGATINFNEPLGIGDLLSARVLASTTGGMQFGRVFYQAPVGDATIGVAYEIFEYHLGKQFSVLDASGTEQIASLYGSYPLLRSYNDNVNIFGDFDYRTFQDRLGALNSTTDKRDFVFSGGVDGSYRDVFLGGGLTAYTLTATFGDLDIETPEAKAIDEVTAQTNGSYAKFSYDVSRLQHLVGPLSAYGEIRGQVASKNLDISEKMELGGAYEVRAYPEGEAYGDEGYVATLEARLLLPKFPVRVPGDIQLIGFVDTGSVTYNKDPWYRGSNNASRSGAGVGLVWSEANNFSASIFYAHELGNQRATSYDDYGDEIWVRLVKYY
jgi:hemolysin activation/secretion protein